MRGRFGMGGMAAVVVVAAGLASCGGHQDHSGPPPGTRSTTAKAAPPRLTDAGPEPGTLSRLWSLASPLTTEDSASSSYVPDGSRRLLDGQLVEESAQGLDAYDARTGGLRWSYHEVGRRLRGYAATAGVIVVRTDGAKPDDTVHTAPGSGQWTGLDASTGRVLWSHADSHAKTQREFFATRSSESFYGGERIVAGGGVVPVSDKEGTELAGIDARTGRDRWSEKVPGGAGCRAARTDWGTLEGFGPASGDGSILPMTVTCEGGGLDGRIVAVDPATGKRRWWWNVAPSEMATSHGYTLVSGGDKGFSVLGPDGHQVARLGGGHQVDGLNPVFEVTAGHAVVSYEDGAERRLTVLLADLRTGRSTSVPVPGGDGGIRYTATASAGGKVYAVSSRPIFGTYSGLLPGAFDVIDPATATVQRRPLPFAVEEFSVPPIGVSRVVWLGAADGRVYMSTLTGGTETVTAYATAVPGAPAELGGVPVADWPDACAIAPGYAVAGRPENGDAFIGSVHLRHLKCMYERGGPMYIAIVWVAARPDEAESILVPRESTTNQPVEPLRLHGVDRAYSINRELWIRAGRYIVCLYDDGPSYRQLAQVIAKSLRSR